MTQQTQGDAVGAASDTIVAAEPTITDRFAAINEEKKPEEEEVSEAAPAEAEETLTPEDVPDEEAESPPIDAPVSWTAEEKEEFQGLPPAAQKVIARREAEREKFVQTKAQEAKQARSQVEQEALATIQQLQGNYAQQFDQYAAHFNVPAPDPQLLVDDPVEYANQLQNHQYWTAQREQAQRQAEGARQQSAWAQTELAKRTNAQNQAVLAEHFPEFLDPTEGPKLREKLASIGLEIGYSAEQLANTDATDILAMRKVSDWKAKAEKFDTLMAQKMERVREGKAMPKLSRPGATLPKGAVANQAYTADREAMRGGNKDAAVRVFSQFLK